MIWIVLLVFFGYLYACAEGWCQGRMCRAEYDDSFVMNWDTYHIVRWFLETGGIVGMVISAYHIAHLSVLASICLFISAISLYEGFFRIARKDTWFYSKVSLWLLKIPHIKWQYEALIFIAAFLGLIITI